MLTLLYSMFPTGAFGKNYANTYYTYISNFASHLLRFLVAGFMHHVLLLVLFLTFWFVLFCENLNVMRKKEVY